jgi:HSP20 family protein
MKLMRQTTPWIPARLDDWIARAFAELGEFARVPGESGPIESLARGHLAADLFEDDHHYYVRVELPGARKEDVTVRLEGGQLTVAYQREDGEHESRVALSRSFRLPGPVAGDRVVAKLDDGLLTVTLPRHEDAKPREIALS